MSYLDVPCPRCEAPTGRRCTDPRGVAKLDTCGARVRASDNHFLEAHGYEPITGRLE